LKFSGDGIAFTRHIEFGEEFEGGGEFGSFGGGVFAFSGEKALEFGTEHGRPFGRHNRAWPCRHKRKTKASL